MPLSICNLGKTLGCVRCQLFHIGKHTKKALQGMAKTIHGIYVEKPAVKVFLTLNVKPGLRSDLLQAKLGTQSVILKA